MSYYKKFSILYVPLQCHMSYYFKFFDPCMPLPLAFGGTATNDSLKYPCCPSYRWVPHVSLLPQLPTSPVLSPSTSPAPPIRPPTSAAMSERRRASLLRPLPSPLPSRHRNPCSSRCRARTWPGRCALPRRGRGPVVGASWPLPCRAFPALWIRGLFALWMANKNRPRAVSAGATSRPARGGGWCRGARVRVGGRGAAVPRQGRAQHGGRWGRGRVGEVEGERWGLKLRNKADVRGP
jgi:hypothetical protein